MKSATKLLLLTLLILTMVVWASAQADPRAYLANKIVDYSVARSLPYQNLDHVMFENVIVNGQHFAVLMKWNRLKFDPVELRQLATTQIARVNPGDITIDGFTTDWGSIAPVMSDPANDLEQNYPITTGTDFTDVYLAHDGEYLYLRMTLANGGPISETQYSVEFQQYLYQLHTPGDVNITAYKYEPDGWWVFVGDRAGCGKAEYPPGEQMAAGVGGCVEWKVPLADVLYPENVPAPFFPAVPANRGIENTFLRVYIHPTPGGVPAGVSDEYDPFTRPMITNFYPYK